MTPEQRKTQLEAAERRYQDEVANILDHHKVITSDGYLGRQNLIDEYCTEFNGMSKTIKEQKTVIARREQTIERLYKAVDENRAVVKEQKTVIARREQTIERLYKTIDELEGKLKENTK